MLCNQLLFYDELQQLNTNFPFSMQLRQSMDLMKTQCLEKQMDRHCKVLSNFSKSPSINNVQSTMRSIVALCNKKWTVKIECEGYIKCSICNKIGDGKPLDCKHVVHSLCLQNKAKAISQQSFDPDMLLNLKCEVCKKIIQHDQYTRIIGRNVIQAYQKKANDKLIQEIRKIDQQQKIQRIKKLNFECALCLTYTLISDGITMSCTHNHRFCKECAEGMILQQIADGKFQNDAIKCAAEGCNEALAQQLIKHCIGEEEYNKYINLQYKNLKVEGMVIRQCNGYIYKTGEKLVDLKQGLDKKQYIALQDQFQRKCNAIQSGNVAAAQLKGEVDPCPAIISFHTEENKEGGILKCYVCSLQCCIKGCSSSHRGNTCEKYRQWEETNKKGTELSFEEIRKLGMAQCQNPKCRVPILRSAGCDWIKCRCGFENCYVCSKAWTLEDVHVKPRGGHAPFDVAKFLREHP